MVDTSRTKKESTESLIYHKTNAINDSRKFWESSRPSKCCNGLLACLWMDGCKDMMLKEAHEKMRRNRYTTVMLEVVNDESRRKRCTTVMLKRTEGSKYVTGRMKGQKNNIKTYKMNANKTCLKALNASQKLFQPLLPLQSTAPAVVPNVSTSAQPHNSTPPQKPL
jgi:hypothetical protein